MSRTVFVSYAKRDLRDSPSFDPAAWGATVGAIVVGHHLLPDEDTPGIHSKVRNLLDESSVTVVLVGHHAAASASVAREIAWTLDAGHGLLGVKLDSSATTPDALYSAGAEILDWSVPDDVEYFGRAVEAAEEGARILRLAAARGSGAGAPCARPLPYTESD